jgi:hypothetical protein
MDDYSAGHPYNPDRFPHFEPPIPSPKFYDVMHAVSGETRVKNHLITIAREEFLSCLLTNEGVTSRLQGWCANIGLPEIEHDIADFLDRVAQRLDLSHRATLGRTPPPPRTRIEDLLPEWDRLQGRLYTAYCRAPEVVEAACVYVHDELRQSWPWLAFRLTHDMFEQAWERAMGITLVGRRVSYLDDNIFGPLVQPFRSVFETRTGETVTEAKQRRMAEAEEDCNNMQAMESAAPFNLPKGSLRRDQEPNTRRNTRWLFQFLVCKESKYRIAKAYHGDRRGGRQHKEWPSCSCQGDVRDGIKGAQVLLDLTPHHF